MDDAVEGTLLAMRAPGSGNTFNIGNDREEYSIEQLARLILANEGRENASIENATAANDPSSRRCPEITRARTILGYDPKVTLPEGLKRTLAWYKDNPKPRA